MINKGRIRKFFPGANSAYGFFSYYDQIAGPEANRIIIFKGGPGAGKSSFMKNIGKILAEQGYELEYHFCSSDNDALDALYIPEKKIALMDGTAPHVIEPKYPGAVEEIINFGQYWQAEKIREQKSSIIGLQEEISRSFQQAYRMLAAAKLYRDAFEDCFQETDEAAVLSLTEEILEKILAGEKKPPRSKKTRTLFASAITPGGAVNYLDTLLDGLSHVYILNGENKRAKRKVIAKVLHAAVEHGHFVEIFSCALDPRSLDHLIIPELDMAVINSSWPHNFMLSVDKARVIDVGPLETPFRKAPDDPEELKNGFHAAFSKAVSFLSRAKTLHDELEGLYIPYMLFEQIDSLQKRTLEEIISS